jgi:hypothetical protein
MAKVMENLIRQNFETKIFSQFSTGFSTKLLKQGFSATINGCFGAFRAKKQRQQNRAAISCFLFPYCRKINYAHHGIDTISLAFRYFEGAFA